VCHNLLARAGCSPKVKASTREARGRFRLGLVLMVHICRKHAGINGAYL
jgi:hypothetical protein